MAAIRLPSPARFFSNIASAWLFKIVSLVVSLVATAVAVRAFGLETMGILVLAVQVGGYALLAELGIPTSLSRSLPGAISRGEISSASRFVSTCFTYLLLVGILLLALTPVISYGLILGLDIPDERANFAWLVFAIMLAITAVALPLRIGVGLLYSTHRFSENFLFETVAAIFKISAILVFFALLSMHPAYYVAITGLAIVLASAIALPHGLRHLPELRLKLMIDRSAFYKMASLGGASFVATLAAMTPMQTTSIALAVFIPPGDVMIYTFPAMITLNALSFAAVLSSMISPVASQTEKNDPGKLQDIVMSATRYSLAMSSIILLGIYFFADEFLRIWLGDAVPEADRSTMYLVLVVLAAGQAIGLIGSPARGALFAMNAHWRTALIELGFNLAGLATGLLIGRLTGELPLAVAGSIGVFALIRGQILLLDFIRRSGGRQKPWIFGVHLPLGLCAAVIGSSSALKSQLSHWHVNDLLIGAVACTLYALIIISVVVEKDHKKRMMVLLRRRS